MPKIDTGKRIGDDGRRRVERQTNEPPLARQSVAEILGGVAQHQSGEGCGRATSRIVAVDPAQQRQRQILAEIVAIGRAEPEAGGKPGGVVGQAGRDGGAVESGRLGRWRGREPVRGLLHSGVPHRIDAGFIDTDESTIVVLGLRWNGAEWGIMRIGEATGILPNDRSMT